ncbi:kinase-like domain-containing protein [Xylaria sp. FL0933]|nr:kinase-like domain-containing protein [Xylaria sp. FL0933]
MHSHLVTSSRPGRAEHNTSESEGHISLRFRPVPGRESHEALKGRNHRSRREIDDTWDSDGESSIINVRDLGFSIAPYSTRAVDGLSIRGVMSADELRAHLNLKPEAGASVKRSIKEKIKSCLVRNQSHLGVKGGRYLPINELYTILNDESIRALLQEQFPHKQWKDICNKLEAYLCRRRILGILLYMHPEDLWLFPDFISGNITDQDLPLTPMGSSDEPGFRTQREKEDTTTMMKWEDNDVELFYSYQPIFLAPFFDIQEKRLCNYSLDESIQLPWLNNEFKNRGGVGMVHRVEIHPGHHNFKSRQPSKTPLYFALKEIPNIDVEIYKQELLALEKPLVQMQKEKHLIKLLLTFKHGQKYYFLFEWADGDLWDYWNKYPGGSKDAILNSTLLAEQCLGLATAVKRIHGLATWQKEKRKKSAFTNKNEKDWGRHGDIKPHNILWFSSRADGCLFVLSDLGLTRYHSSVTRSLVSPTSLHGCTDSYRPPEMDMPGQHICSKYDIWSLGCVFLEFCTWWLRGSRSVKLFENERAADDSVRMVDDPKYFFIPTDDGAKPKVKPTVLSWIKGLRNDPNGDLFAKSMLDLIENHMLVVDKQKRWPADVVCREILSIVTRLRSLPAIRINHEHSDSRSRNELLVPLRHLREQKEWNTKLSGPLEQYLVPHMEDCWESRLSSSGLDPAMGGSSNDDSADEVPGPMTPDSISFNDNPTSNHEAETDIKEWRLDEAS